MMNLIKNNKMSNQEKKERKMKSIELMESIKVQEWKKNQVFNEISSFEWVELKIKVGNLSNLFLIIILPFPGLSIVLNRLRQNPGGKKVFSKVLGLCLCVHPFRDKHLQDILVWEISLIFLSCDGIIYYFIRLMNSFFVTKLERNHNLQLLHISSFPF